MRIWRGLAALALVATGLVAAAGPLSAQSVLQRFFGNDRSDQPAYGRWRRSPYIYNRYRSGRDDYDSYSYGSQGSQGWQEDYNVYATVCVRMCDGYYFPISYGVRRGRLYKDSRTCMRRCDGEARLFYYDTNGGSVETMVDMGGRPYSALPNAFAYRKSLVSGCTCKPAPWSVESAARHQNYATEAAQSKANAEIEGDDRIDREARMAQSNRDEVEGYGDAYDRSADPGYDDAYERPRRSRPQFYSRWRRQEQWDEAPIEAPYDH